MNASHPHVRRAGLAICMATALLGVPAAQSADDTRVPSDVQARYQQERAACEGGQSQQDRATCLREAGAALQQARQGRLADGRSDAQYEQNSFARCQVLPTEERDACIARMSGQGTTRGSVAEGGIYRELVTREYPAANPGAAPGGDTTGGRTN